MYSQPRKKSIWKIHIIFQAVLSILNEVFLLQLLQLVATVEEDLSRGPVNSLDSVLRQCMYLGLSLSRVGADCRGLLAPIFAKTVQNSLEVALRRASRQFEQDMETFTLPKSSSNITRNFSSSQESNEVSFETVVFFFCCFFFCFLIWRRRSSRL